MPLCFQWPCCLPAGHRGRGRERTQPLARRRQLPRLPHAPSPPPAGAASSRHHERLPRLRQWPQRDAQYGGPGGEPGTGGGLLRQMRAGGGGGSHPASTTDRETSEERVRSGQGSRVGGTIIRADSRLVPSQWETPLLCIDVSHWLGTSLESVLIIEGRLQHRRDGHRFLFLSLRPRFL